MTMHILVLLIIFGGMAYVSPRAFGFFVCGPLIGFPLGTILWSLVIQVNDRLFTFHSWEWFAGIGTVVVGAIFARR